MKNRNLGFRGYHLGFGLQGLYGLRLMVKSSGLREMRVPGIGLTGLRVRVKGLSRRIVLMFKLENPETCMLFPFYIELQQTLILKSYKSKSCQASVRLV